MDGFCNTDKFITPFDTKTYYEEQVLLFFLAPFIYLFIGLFFLCVYYVFEHFLWNFQFIRKCFCVDDSRETYQASYSRRCRKPMNIGILLYFILNFIVGFSIVGYNWHIFLYENYQSTTCTIQNASIFSPDDPRAHVNNINHNYVISLNTTFEWSNEEFIADIDVVWDKHDLDNIHPIDCLKNQTFTCWININTINNNNTKVIGKDYDQEQINLTRNLFLTINPIGFIFIICCCCVIHGRYKTQKDVSFV